MTNELESPIRYVKGVGPKKAELLGNVGVFTVLDLLFHFPRMYADRRACTPIGELSPGAHATVLGEVTSVFLRKIGFRRTILEATIADESGSARAVWFNQPYLMKHVTAGVRLRLFGQVSYRGGLQIQSEEFELVRDGETGVSISFGRIVPVYPLTRGVNQKDLRKIIRNALDKYLPFVEDFQPPELVKEKKFPPLADALRDIHFPRSGAAQKRAVRRVKFDELFLLELALALTREHFRRRDGNVIKVSKQVDARIRRRFPFKFTAAQDRAVREITADLAARGPMNRLLQGDVGSGKTAVAVYAMLAAIAAGYQAAVMAPTEILAEQHNLTLRRLLEGASVRILLLCGGDKAAARREKLAALKSGAAHLVVGTHALIQEDVEFANLGLVVVDEQHKFGVMQRMRLKHKGRLPEMLVMTATPIPRTLAMTAFGDLDVSIIDQMPPGRKPVKTRWIASRNVHKAYESVHAELKKGRQAYIVYPVIEENERLNLRGVKKSHKRIRDEVFPEFRIGLLHGAMKSEDKEAVMEAFRSGEFDVLVATVVIEVGIDVPGATVMLIEHADRFGLAQLHQLRGRIGRGEHSSTCILVGDAKTEEAERRLKTLVRTSDGFKIAEEDLRMRGPGEFFGTRQHGLPELRVADILTDYDILVEARNLAARLAAVDPSLEDPANARIASVLRARFSERMELLRVG
jgi:ATP-dependent DNA helicase RecG